MSRVRAPKARQGYVNPFFSQVRIPVQKILEQAQSALIEFDLGKVVKLCDGIIEITENPNILKETTLLRAYALHIMHWAYKFDGSQLPFIKLSEDQYQAGYLIADTYKNNKGIIKNKIFIVEYVFKFLLYGVEKISWNLFEHADLFYQATLAKVENNYAAELNFYKAANKKYAANFTAWYEAGIAALNLTNSDVNTATQNQFIDEALKLFKKALYYQKDFSAPYFHIAQIEAAKKQYAKAVSTFLIGMSKYNINQQNPPEEKDSNSFTLLTYGLSNFYQLCMENFLYCQEKSKLDSNPSEAKLIDRIILRTSLNKDEEKKEEKESIKISAFSKKAIFYFKEIESHLDNHNYLSALNAYNVARYLMLTKLDSSTETREYFIRLLPIFAEKLNSATFKIEKTDAALAIKYYVVLIEITEDLTIKATLTKKMVALSKKMATEQSKKSEYKIVRNFNVSIPEVSVTPRPSLSSVVEKPKKTVAEKTCAEENKTETTRLILTDETQIERQRRRRQKKEKTRLGNLAVGKEAKEALPTTKITSPDYIPPAFEVPIFKPTAPTPPDPGLASCVVPDVVIPLDGFAQYCLTKLQEQKEICRVFVVGGEIRRHIQPIPSPYSTDLDITFGCDKDPLDTIKTTFPDVVVTRYDNFFKIKFITGHTADLWHSKSLSNKKLHDLRALKLDAEERDFTNGALYTNLTQQLFDPKKRGYKDTLAGQLNTINPDEKESVLSNPIRGLRAIYFKQQGYILSTSLEAALQSKEYLDKLHTLLITNPIKLNTWTHKIFCKRPAQIGLEALKKYGMLEKLFSSLGRLLDKDKKNAGWLYAQFANTNHFSNLNYVYALFITFLHKSQGKDYYAIKDANPLFLQNFGSPNSNIALVLRLAEESYNNYFKITVSVKSHSVLAHSSPSPRPTATVHAPKLEYKKA